MKAVILAGGDLRIDPRTTRHAAGASLLIAADSGLRHAGPLGLEPDLIVGDFDSVEAELLARYPLPLRRRHPVAKDQLDLELAIDEARERGAREIRVLGAFGSRLDQSFAALLIALRLRAGGLNISLHDGLRDAYPMSSGDALTLDEAQGTLFSLLAFEESLCSVRGAKFELDRARLPVGVGLGLSNRTSGRTVIRLHEGLLAVVVEYGHEEAELPVNVSGD